MPQTFAGWGDALLGDTSVASREPGMVKLPGMGAFCLLLVSYNLLAGTPSWVFKEGFVTSWDTQYCLYSLSRSSRLKHRHASGKSCVSPQQPLDSCCPFLHRMSSGVLWKGLCVDMPVSKRSWLRPHLWAVYLPHWVHGEALWAEWVWEHDVPRWSFVSSSSLESAFLDNWE